MSPVILRISMVAICVLMARAPSVVAADVVGTMTVNGKTTPLKYAVATIEKRATDRDGEYLVVLASDVPIAPADRTPARLLALARANRIHAVRILWLTMADWVRAVPYDAGVAESGRQAAEHPTININALDDKRVEIECKSKMLGQPWHFQVSVKAPIEKKMAAIDLEPEATAMSSAVESAGNSGATDPTSLKRRLGSLGYEYTPEMFTHAVKDGRLDAVQLFLKLGMPANTKDSQGNHMMVMTAMMCTRDPEAQRIDVLKALLAGGADVNATDQNKSTALIWAAQSCADDFIEVLIKAGANVNAKAAGGATPLMMANVMSRENVVKMLKAAGAKE